MANIADPTNLATLAVGATNRAARVQQRPWNLASTDGMYRIAAKSGAITGNAIVINSPLFCCRYTGGLSGSSIALVTLIRAVLDVTTIFTAAQEMGLDAIRVNDWTAADSGGTGISISANEAKMDTTMPGMGLSSLRIASTTLLTAGTRTVETNPFAISNQVGERHVNVAAGTGELPQPPQAVLEFRPGAWESPLVIRSGEGFLLRNTVAFPAAGVVTLSVEMAWTELATWP